MPGPAAKQMRKHGIGETRCGLIQAATAASAGKLAQCTQQPPTAGQLGATRHGWSHTPHSIKRRCVHKRTNRFKQQGPAGKDGSTMHCAQASHSAHWVQVLGNLRNDCAHQLHFVLPRARLIQHSDPDPASLCGGGDESGQCVEMAGLVEFKDACPHAMVG